MRLSRFFFVFFALIGLCCQAEASYEKQQNLHEHLKAQDRYEKQRKQDFKQYKKDVSAYKNTQLEILKKKRQEAWLQKIYNQEIEKENQLKKEWEAEEKKYEDEKERIRKNHIRQRDKSQKINKKYPVQEFDFL